MRSRLSGRLGDRVLIAGALTLVAVAVAAVLLFFAVRSLRQATDRARRSSDVVATARNVEKLVLDTETGARGFVITRQERFLEPWKSARRTLPGAFRTLDRLTAGDPGQRARVGTVRREVTAYVNDYSVPLVAEVRRGGRAAAIVATGEGKRRVDSIRATFEGLFAEEETRADARAASVANRARVAYAVIAAASVLSLLSVAGLVLFTRRRITAPLERLQAAASLLEAGDFSGRLLIHGARGGAEVGTLATSFDSMALALEREQIRVEQANADLSRSNAELEQFAYVASHDLSEPLRVVAGFTDLLSRRAGDSLSEDARSYMTRILSGTERMQLLIDDLLRYSRAGRAELEMRPLDPRPIVLDALGRLEISRQEARAEVEVDALPAVWGDERQLAVVFQNLLANAIKFHRPDGEAHHVHVGGALDGTVARLWVEDDGIGIAPEHRERIFRMFQRLHTRSEYPGTGIGLALCQRIVERHGGRIEVEDSPTGGARFVVCLPAGERPPGVEDSRGMSLEAELVDILLVEDSADDVELTKAAFEDAQVANRLYVARHGEEAMDFMHRRPPFGDAPRPDLILLDLNLPRKDGREVLTEIKEDPEFASIPVVILTTSSSDEDIARAYQHHANSYIRKPVTFDGLIEAVKTLRNYWLGMVTLPRD